MLITQQEREGGVERYGDGKDERCDKGTLKM